MCDKCSGSVEKCLEMSREVDRFNRKAHAEKVRNFYRDQGREQEQQRIIDLLIDLNAVRRCAATNKLVAFNTDGNKVIYLTGVENE